MCKVYTGYCGTSEIEHSLCACTVDNPLAKGRGLSLRTGAQTMLYLPLVILKAGGEGGSSVLTRRPASQVGGFESLIGFTHPFIITVNRPDINEIT